jgi:nitrogen fixation NifU-like protein
MRSRKSKNFSDVDFEELYQDVILDHSRRPRNYGELPGADARIHANNPMCGDDVTVHVKFGPENTVDAISFSGNGCSICIASASLMTLKLRKKSRTEVLKLMRDFNEMLTSEIESEPDKHLGDLRLLRGVRKFPLRVKCATLAWHALGEALGASRPPISEADLSIQRDHGS